MEKSELPREKTRLETLQEAIKNSPEEIGKEFSETTNSWLACFGSRVFVIETYLSSPRIKKMLSPEKYEEANERLEKLKEKLQELKERYPEKKTIPPDEVKQELLEQLDIFERNNSK